MNTDKKAAGIIYALAGGICWGLSGVAGAIVFDLSGVSPEWMVNVRLLISGLLLLSAVAVKEKSGIFEMWKNRRNLPLFFFFSVFGMGLCQYAYFSAISYSNPATATVIQYTAPAIILLYFAVIQRKIPSAKQILSLMLAMVGVFLLATGGNITSLAISGKAFAWSMVSAVSMVVFNVAPARLMFRYGTPCVVGWGMLVAGIIMSFIGKPWSFSSQWVWSTEATIAFAVVILIGTVLAFALYLRGVSLAGAETASLIASVEPLTATIATVFVMHISFSMVEFAGIISILAAVLMLSVKSRKNI